ncbi:D-tyrosyl-tRNA(Tyr) deacylase [Coraliomargarita sinensis]|uniref:D-aminoacyl-tRNA deacylase n=1 Tax=Coraliomargarita sinensis TaxID=2174842 RepID=A0A317ZJB6_9BACT|nr:D-aminoacyl-tRNA deacylase [Coraliomargarita sinensis]PXA05640.1 D-tyrosyl-tRNA(Tyr) deacylase [Coraliomargarita sinensis]
MRIVIQRVSRAQVTVEENCVGSIDKGLLLFLGVGQGDEESDADWLVKRITKIRLFESAPGRMDLALPDIGGGALVISQFTLFGSLKKGNRPSFNRAAPPERAKQLYEYFAEQLALALGRPVPTGEFGADMQIEAHNDGPVTLMVDSRNRDF